jgi:hypothetical protein
MTYQMYKNFVVVPKNMGSCPYRHKRPTLLTEYSIQYTVLVFKVFEAIEAIEALLPKGYWMLGVGYNGCIFRTLKIIL